MSSHMASSGVISAWLTLMGPLLATQHLTSALAGTQHWSGCGSALFSSPSSSTGGPCPPSSLGCQPESHLPLGSLQGHAWGPSKEKWMEGV